jgi:predicted 3-demethylubiquinone-9 3-methyltransferase (glyoxalase superfamily)
VNASATDMILYKEIQEDPRLVNLSPDLTQWSQVPSSQGFWEYTSEFDNIYSEAEDGFVLEAGKKVTWIKSKLGYGYQVAKNTAAE